MALRGPQRPSGGHGGHHEDLSVEALRGGWRTKISENPIGNITARSTDAYSLDSGRRKEPYEQAGSSGPECMILNKNVR